MNKQINIIVKTLTGKEIPIQIGTDEPVRNIKNKVQMIDGIPSDQQRLIYKGKQLGTDHPNPDVASGDGEDVTVGAWGIKEGTVIHLVLTLRDIGVFASHIASPGMEFLQQGRESDRNEEKEELGRVIQQVKMEKGMARRKSNNFSVYENVVSSEICGVLRDYVDARRKEEEERGRQREKEISADDFQVFLSLEQLKELIGFETVNNLLRIFGGKVTEVRIRHVEASPNSNSEPFCINFHTDYSLKTLQVALNDDTDYDGGKLTFLVEEEDNNGRKVVPERKEGTVTVHDNTIVHGVSQLTKGGRYGLFFLHKE